MIDYNNISYILKDVLGTNDISEKSLEEALIITYKDWKINKLRQEQQNIRQSLNGKVFICERCGNETPYIEIHHNIPIELGGDNTRDNIKLLCHECHLIENKNTGVFIKSARTRDKTSPINNIETLNNIFRELYKTDIKYYLIFGVSLETGVNPNIVAGYNINDINKLLYDKCIHIGNSTKKINNLVLSELEEYIHNYTGGVLFSSRKKNSKQISRQHLHRVLSDCCKRAGYTEEVSLDTMCKTFYIQCLHSGINIYDIMKELNMKNKHEVEEYLHIDNR